MTNIDLGRATSAPLVEVRTVLSRAETALESLKQHDGTDTWSHFESTPGMWVSKKGRSEACLDDFRAGAAEWVDGEYIPHPDYDRMVTTLEEVVRLLSPWKRTGRPLKKRGPK